MEMGKSMLGGMRPLRATYMHSNRKKLAIA